MTILWNEDFCLITVLIFTMRLELIDVISNTCICVLFSNPYNCTKICRSIIYFNLNNKKWLMLRSLLLVIGSHFLTHCKFRLLSIFLCCADMSFVESILKFSKSNSIIILIWVQRLWNKINGFWPWCFSTSFFIFFFHFMDDCDKES